MYVSIGSTCNVCVERDKRRATVMQFNPDGSGGRIYASGLRNAVGLRFDSAGRLWATSNGRDWLGDDTPPDELHILEDGMSAGWPFCHAGKYKDPEPKYAALGSCEQVKRPVWGFRPTQHRWGQRIHRHSVSARVPRRSVRSLPRQLEPLTADRL